MSGEGHEREGMSGKTGDNAKKAPAGGTGRKRLKRLMAPLIVLVVAAGVVLVALVPSNPGGLPPPKPEPVKVEVMEVRAVPEMADTILLPGAIEPNRIVDVAAEVHGRIERLDCREGRTCRAGEALIRFNTDLLQAEYDQARSAAEFDRRELERLTQLDQRGMATPAELDRARAKAAASKAALDAAEARLDRAVIHAPISGVLDRLLVEVGEYVSPGDLVCKIVDVGTVKAVVDVSERDVPFLSVGESTEVLVDVRGRTESRAGKITYISELADQQTRTSRVEVAVVNPPGQAGRRLLRSGQLVRVRLTRRVLSNVIMVPLQAVIPLEDGKAVYVVEGDVAQRRELELGFIKGRSVQVLSGLSGGERLIVSGHQFVAPGQQVTVLDRK